MLKTFVLPMVLSLQLFAMSASMNMPLIKDVDYGYPTSGKEAVSMVMNGQACLLDKGEEVVNMDSSFSYYKVRGRVSGCIGWAPKEYFKL
ncbi:MAG: hypothetical protein WC665_05865 [Sulfurimonas sp.]|jgi:hypothetical protein